jgi:hypothetical protein
MTTQSGNSVKNKPKLLGKKTKRANVLMCCIDDCHSFLNSAEELQRHMDDHSRGNIFVCKTEGCVKSFINEENFVKHNKSHAPAKKLYKCDFPGCNKNFTASYNQKVLICLIYRYIIEYMSMTGLLSVMTAGGAITTRLTISII